ncbi:MAG TPA: DUF4926 domain-containing protein [Tepidisphaeraceae bacterium]|nr:DUF4926 domain-containing protein [Tepidisphaeraceae bacterium]
MNEQPKIHDVVALLENTPAKHFERDEPLLLHRGQIGTVVMIYENHAYEVEFADQQGRTYAMLTIPGEKLMVLHDAPEQAVA